MKVIAVAILAVGLIANDALASVALAALAGGYWLLGVGGRVPVLFAAYSFQWVQVCSGYFYTLVTGRGLEATHASDYRTMMYLGLASIVTLAAGIRAGHDALARRTTESPIERRILSQSTLLVLYLGSLAVTASVQVLAWTFPLFTQPIIALTFARFAILYLLLRRLAAPDFQAIKIAAVMALEVTLGLTSYFAGFREPLVLGILAILETFDRRRVSHWATVATLVAVASGLGLMWLGIRTEYRRDFAAVENFAESRDVRLARIQELTQGWWKQDPQEFWWNLDVLVDRLWAIYYPALAVARVPLTLPHTDGEILSGMLRHIFMPRVLFPDKPPLESDSEMVRKYAGVWVAGADEGTSIAFGYVAEAYIDFGVPLMFLPILVWGLFLGAAYRAVLVLIRHREISVPVVAVVFWLALYLFERSWVKTVGTTGTMLIYVVGLAWIVDRLLLTIWRRQAVYESRAPHARVHLPTSS